MCSKFGQKKRRQNEAQWGRLPKSNCSHRTWSGDTTADSSTSNHSERVTHNMKAKYGRSGTKNGKEQTLETTTRRWRKIFSSSPKKKQRSEQVNVHATPPSGNEHFPPCHTPPDRSLGNGAKPRAMSCKMYRCNESRLEKTSRESDAYPSVEKANGRASGCRRCVNSRCGMPSQPRWVKQYYVRRSYIKRNILANL